MSMENYNGKMSTDEKLFVHYSSLSIPLAESSGSKQEELGEKNDEFGLAKCFCSDL
jgi:hypothetical protein